ncbi:glycoside hydrolase family 15 protein [Agrococcus sediminis]|uniref:glycoside hydrolase family 15 protein n=1 Tax=Agrococcus sediminis TaxID=2599924 RepID=UPI00343BB5AF
MGDLHEHPELLLERLQDSSGAYPASPTFSAYRGYSWFRDGAFIADGASAAGLADSADRFFDWCSRTIAGIAPSIDAIVAAQAAGTPLPDSAMPPTRFRFDGTAGEDDWWDFQLDGYGTWLWAMEAHAVRHDRAVDRHAPAVVATVRLLVSSWDRPCFDWWEEHDEHRHVSTLGCVGAGLEAALRLDVLPTALAAEARRASIAIRELVHEQGLHDGHLVKWLGSTDVDGSLSALVAPIGWIDPDSALARTTLDAIHRDLEVDGGVHRFRDDTFFGGGQWPLLSCFLGLAELAAGDRREAERLLEWARSTATADGLLPEQVGRHLLAPDSEAEWIERWGPVATPLLWSHAMVARLEAALAADREVAR